MTTTGLMAHEYQTENIETATSNGCFAQMTAALMLLMSKRSEDGLSMFSEMPLVTSCDSDLVGEIHLLVARACELLGWGSADYTGAPRASVHETLFGVPERLSPYDKKRLHEYEERRLARSDTSEELPTGSILVPLGPYTPEHPGPFCTPDGIPIDLKIRDGRGKFPLVGYRGDAPDLALWTKSGGTSVDDSFLADTNLMNAVLLAAPTEFWANFYANDILTGDGLQPKIGMGAPYLTYTEAVENLMPDTGHRKFVHTVLVHVVDARRPSNRKEPNNG